MDKIVQEPDGVKITCDICNEYEGTKAQVLSGHKPRCKEKKRKTEREAEAKELAQLKADLEEAAASGKAGNTLWQEEFKKKSPEAELPVQELSSESEPEFEEMSSPVSTRDRDVPDRKKRTPLGVRRKRLDAPTEPGFHYHWLNDEWDKDPNRVADAEAGGYVHVKGTAPRTAGVNDGGKPIMGRLMRIPLELYDADQAEKQREIDEKEKLINEGSYDLRPGDNRYVPDGARNRQG